MSTSVFPTLVGLAWPQSRVPQFKTRKQVSISGKETRIADWAYPRYQWSLAFDFLRQGNNNGNAYTEFDVLEGFFEKMVGGWDTFLFIDPDDNTVANQPIATTPGGVTAFQMIRTFGGANTLILAPNLSLPYTVYLNGSPLTYGTQYTISTWGALEPGVITLTSDPGVGVVLSASFSYYWPCRFDDDNMSFQKFLSYVYDCKKVSFTSVK